MQPRNSFIEPEPGTLLRFENGETKDKDLCWELYGYPFFKVQTDAETLYYDIPYHSPILNLGESVTNTGITIKNEKKLIKFYRVLSVDYWGESRIGWMRRKDFESLIPDE